VFWFRFTGFVCKKSANVLISESFVAKISDFGIAKRLAIHTMTMRVGTTRWMAPEVLTNKGSSMAYSLGSDVYSFGIIVWEMLTLELPWGNVSFDHQIEDRVTAGEHLDISHSVEPYRDLLLRCWNFDAQLRPAFMELIGRIDEIPSIEGSPERVQ
jgi:sterile alpha motif and leucine zipper-containing kinase AZK